MSMAHIAALLVTFFHEQMPELIRNGHLYIAVPPLYRLAQAARQSMRATTPTAKN